MEPIHSQGFFKHSIKGNSLIICPKIVYVGAFFRNFIVVNLYKRYLVYSNIFNGFQIQRSTGMHNICILLLNKKNKEKVFTNHLNLCLLDPPTAEQVPSITVKEGEHVTWECKAAAGTPPLNEFWKIVKTSENIPGKLLNITNIRRNQSGEYKCFANNTCGNDSSTMSIDVQCKNQHITSLFTVCSHKA